MKIQSTKKSWKKPLIVTSAVAALLLAGLLTYVYAFDGDILGWNNGNKSGDGSTDLNKPTDEQKAAGDRAKQDTVNDTKPNSNNSDTPSQPTAPQPGSSKSTVDVIVTAKSSSQLRVLISDVDNSGTCTLTLTQGSQTVTKTSGTQAQSSSSTCKGFDFQLSSGSWQAVVKYEGSNAVGSATTTIQV